MTEDTNEHLGSSDCSSVVSAAIAVLEWYFRDGSVGGAEDPMYELMRVCGVTEEWLRRK